VHLSQVDLSSGDPILYPGFAHINPFGEHRSNFKHLSLAFIVANARHAEH